jgi:ankyrin repeat protein
MWRVAATYLPAAEIAQLATCCKYFNEQVIWHPHSTRLVWAEVPQTDLDEALLLNVCKGAHVQVLIDAGAKATQSALFYAIQYGRTRATRALIAAGVDVNAAGAYCVTPLVSAITRSRVRAIRMLIAAGANVNATYGGMTWTPLIFSIRNIYKKSNADTLVLRALITAGADVNAVDEHGYTPLMHAVIVGCMYHVRALLAAGAHIDTVDNNGYTLLMHSCVYSHSHISRALIELGVDVNARNNDGFTALMYTVRSGCGIDTARTLLAHGADVNAANGAALDFAILAEYDDIAQVLRDAGAQNS